MGFSEGLIKVGEFKMKFELKKIQKLENITSAELSEYRKNPHVRRSKEVKGGFDKIVYATDQD